jgi:ABC-type dipeptide/oligopeptide/nickel transport system ATPase component
MGCAFNPRCERVFDTCRLIRPEIIHHKGHDVACHLYADETMEAAR